MLAPTAAQNGKPNSHGTQEQDAKARKSTKIIVMKSASLWSFQLGADNNIGGAGWTKVQPASQIIEVPAGMRLALIASRSLSDLSDLRSLPSDIVLALDLRDTPIKDTDLACRSHLKGLRRLDLGGTAIGDRGLAYLRGLTNLTRLDLVKTAVTDQGLVNLKMMKSLSTIELSKSHVNRGGLSNIRPADSRLLWFDVHETDCDDRIADSLRNIRTYNFANFDVTNLTDAGLAKLLKQSTFVVLQVGRTKITGSGFADLRQNVNTLQVLGLDDTQVDDKAIAYIARCRNIHSLYLNSTAISDKAMSNIALLSQLQTLRLRKTNLTDAALPYLQKLTQLRQLELPNTISRVAGLRLKQLLPGYKIMREHI
jgi:Leucine-rich repeat (LRR) protein